MLREFREFILRGNVVDLMVGFIVGAAFTALVRSTVTHLVMPPLGLLVGDIDFSNRYLLLRGGEPPPPYATPADAEAAGAVTLDYGIVVDETISFLVVGFAVFLVVRAINRWQRRRQGAAPAEPTTKECPYCVSTVPIRARRCPACTSELPEGADPASRPA